MIYLALAIVILILFIDIFISIKKFEKDDNKITDEYIPYSKKFLLTKNEYSFYKKLKPIAEELNLTILAKVRLADLIEVNKEVKGKERLKYFSKIKSKHIDFVLCNKENLYPKLLIELQDNSHNQIERIKRDEFIKKITEKTEYKIIFIYGNEELENKIKEILTH